MEKDKKGVVKTISSVFNKSFENGDFNSESNISSFVQELTQKLSTRKTEFTAAEISEAFIGILQENLAKQGIDTSALFKCVKNLNTQILDRFAIISESQSEAIFFPGKPSLNRLVEVLKKARKTLRVCLFTISEDTLTKTLIALKEKGVDVKIITDDQCKDNQGSDIELLAQNGIPCRIDLRADAHMHNKFAIIDENILVNGSFNWTYAAVTKNNENITILGDKKLINRFIEHFDKLWEEFKKAEL